MWIAAGETDAAKLAGHVHGAHGQQAQVQEHHGRRDGDVLAHRHLRHPPAASLWG